MMNRHRTESLLNSRLLTGHQENNSLHLGSVTPSECAAYDQMTCQASRVSQIYIYEEVQMQIVPG